MKRLFVLLVLLGGMAGSMWGVDFALRKDDRVLFYGDSITQQRMYTNFVESFVVTRFPDHRVVFVNSGWGGDRVTGGHGGPIDVRLARDLFPYKPTVLTVMLGMNDGRYTEFNEENFEIYTNGYDGIAKAVKGKLPGARVTLIATSPYDDVTRAPKFAGGYNEVLVKYGEFVRGLAKKNGFEFVDFNAPVVSALKKARKVEAPVSELIIKDRVHPGAGGHLVMAMTLLKAWNAPSLVSVVEFDVSGEVPSAKAANTKLDKIFTLKTGGLEWEQLDEVLPLGIDFSDAAVALAAEVSDAAAALNLEMLKVRGLKKGYYSLEIDEMDVGTFTSEELENGVNLGGMRTPMMEQALLVAKIVQQKNTMHHDWWRQVQVPVFVAKNEKAVAASGEVLEDLAKGEEAFARVARAAAEPVLRKYRLAPAAPPPDGMHGKSVIGGGAISVPAGLSGVNLALNKPYESSDANTSSWGGGLTDGSWEMKQYSTFATGIGPFPKHVTVDLGKVQPIACVVTGVPNFGSTKDVEVSVSADGKRFQKVGRHTFSLRQEEARIFGFAPLAARYVRLTFLENYTEKVNFRETYGFATELQVFGPKSGAGEAAAVEAPVAPAAAVPAGVNLALNKPYESSDPNKASPQFKWGEGLTDGSWAMSSVATFATGCTNKFPKWVTIDLEKKQAVSKVVLGVPNFGSTKTVEVSVSEDGKKFSPVGKHDFQPRQEERRTFEFAAREARHVRITYVENHEGKEKFDPNYCFTSEVEVYGPAK